MEKNTEFLLLMKKEVPSRKIREFSQIQYLHRCIMANIEALIFIPSKEKKMITVVEGLLEDIFIMKSILSRQQRVLLKNRSENIKTIV